MIGNGHLLVELSTTDEKDLVSLKDMDMVFSAALHRMDTVLTVPIVKCANSMSHLKKLLLEFNDHLQITYGDAPGANSNRTDNVRKVIAGWHHCAGDAPKLKGIGKKLS